MGSARRTGPTIFVSAREVTLITCPPAEPAPDWVAMAQEVVWVPAGLVWAVMVELAFVGFVSCQRKQLRDSSTLLGMTNYWSGLL